MRVLFVAADPAFVRVFAEQSLAEHEVTLAASVAEAQGRLTTRRYDVVLVDQVLPDGLGSEVLDHAYQAIVVLFHEAGNDSRREGAVVRCPKRNLSEIVAALASLS
ncbi:hypothetical protein [Nannocystis pusilla]|uniref:hypothetical protein n=1 Tax=Nannocystis pusilla TaxID=889268 RepID=UPI003DA3FE5C